MVIYEVAAIVEADQAFGFEAFLTEGHIADVLSTAYFSGAAIERCGDCYRIRYSAVDRARIDEYLEKSAPSLRADFLRHFPSGVKLSREIWEVQAIF